ncbi:hypothetical protein HYH03_014140 [Edaphochlamys debaryana]|uniref:Uncharacterized protein n=1 Tax=Edaphochlamys debaryana TaxID=47281 RepID=A0A836BSJ3_9CHLO|nr:hypothetical protein HYH03_014140 [Edaphochlamys debaryana]|eukprot:KAG2487300.1 hypothetical protein HYH03_014140 [Edaphochlamys debaryana]
MAERLRGHLQRASESQAVPVLAAEVASSAHGLEVGSPPILDRHGLEWLFEAHIATDADLPRRWAQELEARLAMHTPTPGTTRATSLAPSAPGSPAPASPASTTAAARVGHGTAPAVRSRLGGSGGGGAWATTAGAPAPPGAWTGSGASTPQPLRRGLSAGGRVPDPIAAGSLPASPSAAPGSLPNYTHDLPLAHSPLRNSANAAPQSLPRGPGLRAGAAASPARSRLASAGGGAFSGSWGGASWGGAGQSTGWGSDGDGEASLGTSATSPPDTPTAAAAHAGAAVRNPAAALPPSALAQSAPREQWRWAPPDPLAAPPGSDGGDGSGRSSAAAPSRRELSDVEVDAIRHQYLMATGRPTEPAAAEPARAAQRAAAAAAAAGPGDATPPSVSRGGTGGTRSPARAGVARAVAMPPSRLRLGAPSTAAVAAALASAAVSASSGGSGGSDQCSGVASPAASGSTAASLATWGTLWGAAASPYAASPASVGGGGQPLKAQNRPALA